MEAGFVIASTDPAPLVTAHATSHVHAATVLFDDDFATRALVGFTLRTDHVPLDFVLLAKSTRMPLLLAVFTAEVLAFRALLFH
jgi:hypothetical protein